MTSTAPQSAPEVDQRGVALGLLAYLWWGLSPLFWKQLDDVAAVDTLGWRVVWTSVIVTAIVVATGRTNELRTVARGTKARLAALAAAALIATNWGTYVWAVGAERVTEASLGYFMNPLVSVALGVFVLHEQLRRAQWAAVALASVGVAWLTVAAGSLPWVSLLLAGTFAVYGLIRKVAPAGPIIGLNLEMVILIAPALLLLTARAQSGTDINGDGATMIWLMLTGVITAAPLVWFAAAAKRVPLSIIGLLQFVAPTLQFLLGVVVYNENFSAAQLGGYAIIWCALAVFAQDQRGHWT